MDKKLLNRKKLNKLALGTRTIWQIMRSLNKNQKLHEEEELILASLEELVKHEKLRGKEKKYNTVYLLVLKPWYRKGKAWMYSGKHGSEIEFSKTRYFGGGVGLKMTETEKQKKMTRYILKSCKDAREMTIWETYIHTLLDVKDNKEHYNKIIGPLCLKGSTHTAEARARMSKAQKGRIVSAETRARMSKARKGKTLSAETKEKLRKAMESPEYKEKYRKAMESPEYKEKMRNIRKSPEYKEKHRKAMESPEYEEKYRKAMESPEYEEKYRKAMESPEYKEKHRKAINSPEAKEKRRKAINSPEAKEKRRKAINSPEYKEKMRKVRESPEYKEKMRKAINSPEYKEKQRKIQREIQKHTGIEIKAFMANNPEYTHNQVSHILAQKRKATGLPYFEAVKRLKQQEEGVYGYAYKQRRLRSVQASID